MAQVQCIFPLNIVKSRRRLLLSMLSSPSLPLLDFIEQHYGFESLVMIFKATLIAVDVGCSEIAIGNKTAGLMHHKQACTTYT